MQITHRDDRLYGSIGLFRPSIGLLRKHALMVLWLSMAPALLVGLGGFVRGDFGSQTVDVRLDAQTVTGITLQAIGLLWLLAAYPGYIRARLAAVRDMPESTWHSFRSGLGRLPSWLVTYIVVTCLVLAGGVLLIIPGLIVYRRLFLTSYYMIDGNMGPLAAVRLCFAASNSFASHVRGVVVVVTVLAIGAAAVGRVGIGGYIFGLCLIYMYTFAPAIRFVEIKKYAKPGQRQPFTLLPS
ncbi:MAG TPA: hypothetical protein VF572_01755 [Candidatus Saccharimonadales bacterium]|jgi:hypothetical protein